MLCSFSCINRSEQEESRVTVKIEIQKSAIRRNVLQRKVSQQEALPAASLAQHRHVHRATRGADLHGVSRRLSVAHAKSEIETAALAPRFASPTSQTVPDRNQKFFEELNHHKWIVEASS